MPHPISLRREPLRLNPDLERVHQHLLVAPVLRAGVLRRAGYKKTKHVGATHLHPKDERSQRGELLIIFDDD